MSETEDMLDSLKAQVLHELHGQLDEKQLEVLERFKFHPATEKTGPLHDMVREAHSDLATFIMLFVPRGRHQSLALTAVQESMMWSNAAVACDTKPPVEEPEPEPQEPTDPPAGVGG